VVIAGSGLYLSGNVGGVAGVSGAAALFQLALQGRLAKALVGRDDSQVVSCDELSESLDD